MRNRAEWLDPNLTDNADIQHLLDSLPEPALVPRVVSTRVNSVRNNGPELLGSTGPRRRSNIPPCQA